VLALKQRRVVLFFTQIRGKVATSTKRWWIRWLARRMQAVAATLAAAIKTTTNIWMLAMGAATTSWMLKQ
jgi:hypothetical protein